ncbi:MAG: T9SS type A sorting domain-containing protein, partial [Candidatus Marinimicrobia bacterium]|nr:T9SS type A sorting domain-containing protein [Candidatus Neomarinimicrobiota bacterium]
GGFDITLRWETLGGFGILNWYPNFNELPPYYAMQFLINTANLIEYSEIIKCETTESPKTDAPHHGGMNVNLYNIQPFAIKVNDDKINVILINKYANDTTVVVNIPNGMQSYSLFRYDSSRIINCSTPLITENVEDTITVNCPKYSATVLQFASDKINNIENDKPQIWDISQNFPNPFNNSTTIQYAYPYNFKINITIYNLLGKKVFTLINEKKLAGQYETTWNGKNSDGEIVPAGIYFYKTKLNNITKWKKMVFVK